MTITICFANQKGGVGKSTTSGITAHILAQQGFKVLAVDMDSQGNLSQFLTLEDDLEIFEGETVLEAMKEGNAMNYIRVINDHLHLLPADDYLSRFHQFLYEIYKGSKSRVLSKTLEPVKPYYDFIIIDTPPALGELTINSLFASDHYIIMCETSRFSINAMPRFIRNAEDVQDVNKHLNFLGILVTLADVRRKDSLELLDFVQEEYKGIAFETVIRRKAAIGRLPIVGFEENPELEKALEAHENFVKELLNRVQN